MNRKLLCIGTAAVMLTLLAQTSCGSEKTVAAETGTQAQAETSAAVTEAVTEDTFEQDSLPDDLDFGGATVTVHVRGDEDTIAEMYSEAENGEVVNDAVYERNLAVEERLNVKLNTVYNDGWANYSKTITLLRSTIMAGDPAYDIIAGWSASIPTLVMDGCFLNLKELPYIDFEKTWWTQSVVNSSTINDKLYLLTGDIAMSMLYATYTVFYNKTMAEDYDVEDLYQCVFDGKWTIDKLAEISKSIYQDVNGDGTRDDGDIYGFYAITGSNPDDGFMASTLMHMLTQTSDGYYELNPDLTRLATLAETLYSLYWENEGTFAINAYRNDYDDGDAQGIKMFSENRALFILDYLGSITDYDMNNMESDFGILPYPKLEESQESYGTYVQNGVSMWGVPISAANPEMSAAAMEALASESYRRVTPAYYETALKVKYSRDNESVKMLDLIKDSAQLDFEIIYNESLGSVRYIMRNLMDSKKKDVASMYEKKEKTYQSAVDKVMNYFRSADN